MLGKIQTRWDLHWEIAVEHSALLHQSPAMWDFIRVLLLYPDLNILTAVQPLGSQELPSFEQHFAKIQAAKFPCATWGCLRKSGEKLLLATVLQHNRAAGRPAFRRYHRVKIDE